MSASRDTEQKMKFVYSNFSHLYLQSKVSKNPEDKTGLATGVVLKAHTAAAMDAMPMPAQVQVVSSEEQDRLKKWAHAETTKVGRSSLATQVKTLRSEHKRLVYLLQEIDELLKRE